MEKFKENILFIEDNELRSKWYYKMVNFFFTFLEKQDINNKNVPT